MVYAITAFYTRTQLSCFIEMNYKQAQFIAHKGTQVPCMKSKDKQAVSWFMQLLHIISEHSFPVSMQLKDKLAQFLGLCTITAFYISEHNFPLL